MIRLDEKVVLGLSGGKDSTSLLFLLTELGVDVTPVVVDLGYEDFDANTIARSLECRGFAPTVVAASSPLTIDSAPAHARRQIRSSLSVLDTTGLQTPCTHCSRLKRLLLVEAAKSLGARWVLLGHHLHDFLATILKDYFVARYCARHGTYEMRRFRSFIANDRLELGALRSMVQEGKAATMAIHLPLGSSVSLVRPMAYISEEDLVSFVKRMRISIFGSGCSHDVFQRGKAPATKRELVHLELKRRLNETPILQTELLAVARESLDKSGRPRCNPRAQRDLMYPGFDPLRTCESGTDAT